MSQKIRRVVRRLAEWGGLFLLIMLAVGLRGGGWLCQGSASGGGGLKVLRRLALPAPKKKGSMSVEEALWRRRSQRRFASKKLTLAQISQICWAGQGISQKKSGYRTNPSAGALYPLQLYLISSRGIERYQPRKHRLLLLDRNDRRGDLQKAALNQKPVGAAPLTVVITGIVARTASKYSSRARQYMLLEAGHVAQSILLQAIALGLSGLTVGAFQEGGVTRLLRLPPGESPLYLLPLGYKP